MTDDDITRLRVTAARASTTDVLAALLSRLEAAERERDALLAERDAMAALLARVVDEYDDDYSLTKRLMHEIRVSLAAKEQSN